MSRFEGEQYVWDVAMKLAASDRVIGDRAVRETFAQSITEGCMVTWGEAQKLPIIAYSLRDADLYGNRGWRPIDPKFYALKRFAKTLERL